MRLSALLPWLVCASAGCARGAGSSHDLEHAVAARHADLAYFGYRAAADDARRLQAAIDAFIEAPSAEGFAAARAAWRAARVSYTRTEAFRFYEGPIDAVESRVNAWPIDESYVDYVDGAPQSGIINDVASYPAISAAAIEAANERQGEKNISTGFHAIEFLLWGQDFRRDGPGERPYTDYVGDSKSARRRAEYLATVAGMLVRHLGGVAEAWRPGVAGNYRTQFLAFPSRQAVGLVLKGVGTLSGPELSGERLTVPYETKDPENEHSCFSDNTTADIAGDVEGLRAVILGVGGSPPTTGPGLMDLLARARPTLASRLARELDASVVAARALPSPFDQAILGRDGDPGRQAVKRLIDALTAQTASLEEAAAALEIGLGRFGP